MSAEPTFGELATSLLEVLIATSRGSNINDHGDWPLLQDCFALARSESAPSGLTEDEVRAEVVKEIHHYSTLK